MLLRRIAEQAREQSMMRDAALENKFRKLPNPTSPRNDIRVHNLSSKELTKDHMQVLRPEASFNTADTKPLNMTAALESILSQTEATAETKNLIRHQVSSLRMAQRPREVFAKVKRDALRELKADKDLSSCQRTKDAPQLYWTGQTTFKRPKALTREINATMLALENSGAITPTDRRMARPQDTALALFYGLPKVHKDGAPLRPIVSLKGTPTYGLAKWLFRRLKFLTAESDTTVSSSAQFLEKLKGACNLRRADIISRSTAPFYANLPQSTIPSSAVSISACFTVYCPSQPASLVDLICPSLRVGHVARYQLQLFLLIVYRGRQRPQTVSTYLPVPALKAFRNHFLPDLQGFIDEA
nr:unnamed protein product [Spirometra erinaceieuropaei]